MSVWLNHKRPSSICKVGLFCPCLSHLIEVNSTLQVTYKEVLFSLWLWISKSMTPASVQHLMAFLWVTIWMMWWDNKQGREPAFIMRPGPWLEFHWSSNLLVYEWMNGLINLWQSPHEPLPEVMIKLLYEPLPEGPTWSYLLISNEIKF